MATKKRPRDVNERAKSIVDIATGEAEDQLKVKDPAAVALGKKGGAARAKKLTDIQRKAIAKKGADARWGDKDKA